MSSRSLPTPPERRAQGAARVMAFFVANVLFAAGLFAHAFLYNFYLDALGLGEGVMGVAAASLTAGGLAALVPAGVLVDRIGPRAAFAASALVATLGLALGAWVTSPPTVYLAAFVAGAGTAGWRVTMGPFVMRVATPAARTRVFSWNVALLLASGAAWTAAAGAIPRWLGGALGGELAGLRAGLLLGALGTLLSVAALVPARLGGASPDEEERGGAPRPPRSAGRPAGERGVAGLPRGLLLAVVFVWLWMTAGGLVLPFFNLYFQRVHGLPIERVGLLLAAVQGATALAVFGSGEWAYRSGPLRTLAAWTLLFPPLLWGLAAAGTLGPAVALFLLQGIVPPATNPLIDQLLLERAPGERQGLVSGWRNGATEMSGLVGGSAGGFLLQHGSFAALLATAGAVALAGGLGLVATLRRLDRSPAAAPSAAGAPRPSGG